MKREVRKTVAQRGDQVDSHINMLLIEAWIFERSVVAAAVYPQVEASAVVPKPVASGADIVLSLVECRERCAAPPCGEHSFDGILLSQILPEGDTASVGPPNPCRRILGTRKKGAPDECSR